MRKSRVQKTGTINKNKIERLIRQLLVELGENPDREGLAETPKRIAEMYEEIFSGYRMNAELDVSFKEETNAIIARDIQFYSMCEHHMLPFFGKAHIAYIHNGRIVGLSKIPRVVDVYARRLQVQERLTHEILNSIHNTIQPLGAAVVIEARHMCMMMRGVQKQNSITTTSAFTGQFRKPETRSEFLALISSKLA